MVQVRQVPQYTQRGVLVRKRREHVRLQVANHHTGEAGGGFAASRSLPGGWGKRRMPAVCALLGNAWHRCLVRDNPVCSAAASLGDHPPTRWTTRLPACSARTSSASQLAAGANASSTSTSAAPPPAAAVPSQAPLPLPAGRCTMSSSYTTSPALKRRSSSSPDSSNQHIRSARLLRHQ